MPTRGGAPPGDPSHDRQVAMTTPIPADEPSVPLLDTLAILESRVWSEQGHEAVQRRNNVARLALDAGWDAETIAAYLGVWSSDVRRWAAAARPVPRQVQLDDDRAAAGGVRQPPCAATDTGSRSRQVRSRDS
jgi:hypothetical protein